jgi:hypothetical protein
MLKLLLGKSKSLFPLKNRYPDSSDIKTVPKKSLSIFLTKVENNESSEKDTQVFSFHFDWSYTAASLQPWPTILQPGSFSHLTQLYFFEIKTGKYISRGYEYKYYVNACH